MVNHPKTQTYITNQDGFLLLQLLVKRQGSVLVQQISIHSIKEEDIPEKLKPTLQMLFGLGWAPDKDKLNRYIKVMEKRRLKDGYE